MKIPESTPLLLLASEPASIIHACRLLRDGGVVAFPTDTLYALGGGIFRQDAIQRIFEAKRRPADAAVPVLLATAADLVVLVSKIPRPAWLLINAFWPGPLTLVLPASDLVPRSVTGGGSTVAVRVPNNVTALRLLETLGEPVVGTSANTHGAPPARNPEEVVRQCGESIDAVLYDEGEAVLGMPSTVVEVSDESCIWRRQGAVSIEAVRRVIGPGVPVHR